MSDKGMPELGIYIRFLREQRQLTQGDLAEVVDVSRTTLTNLESGRFDPSVSLLRRIALVFDFELGDFLVSAGYTAGEAANNDVLLAKLNAANMEIEALKRRLARVRRMSEMPD